MEEYNENALKKKYPLLDKSDINAILNSENKKGELEFRLGVIEAIKEDDVMDLRKKLNETYKEFRKNENKNKPRN